MTDAKTPAAAVKSADRTDAAAGLRRTIYALLIVVGAAGVAGRILSVDAVDSARLEGYLFATGRPDWQKKTPFLSANDRSRWLTIRSLVERGTYEIDEIIAEPNWDSIDVVKHDEHGRAAPAPGQGHFYSSKPPLLSTILAGEYWLIYHLAGYSLKDHPYGVGRFMLLTINVPLLVVMWTLLARYVERYGRTDFGRVFTMAAAVFATLQTTFAVSLNNHLVAAMSAMVLLDAVVRIVVEGDLRPRRFVQAGFFAAFLAANELPALSIAALAGAGLLWRFPRPTVLFGVPAALVVAVAALGTNYAAHGTIKPAYGQRDPENNWYVFQYEKGGRIIDSYWSRADRRSAIDRGEPSPAAYAFHVLVGHHGIFSLTPIWLLTIIGLGRMCRERGSALRPIAAAIALASLVCLVFYLARPQLDRNYGGMAAGFRWVFWFVPLWLVGVLAGADAFAASKPKRIACYVMLAISVVSVTFPTWNPWTLPWLTQLCEFMGWAKLGS
jgi:hypothetical protein